MDTAQPHGNCADPACLSCLRTVRVREDAW